MLLGIILNRTNIIVVNMKLTIKGLGIVKLDKFLKTIQLIKN